MTWLLNPILSSILAALLVGEPELALRLVRICKRESACQAIGVHPNDAHRGGAAWRNAVSRGRLDPAQCSAHARGEPARWSTRGAWGTMAAYTVPYLGRCVPPWVLDVPIVGALAAAHRLRAARSRRVPALLRWSGYGQGNM